MVNHEQETLAFTRHYPHSHPILHWRTVLSHPRAAYQHPSSYPTALNSHSSIHSHPLPYPLAPADAHGYVHCHNRAAYRHAIADPVPLSHCRAHLRLGLRKRVRRGHAARLPR